MKTSHTPPPLHFVIPPLHLHSSSCSIPSAYPSIPLLSTNITPYWPIPCRPERLRLDGASFAKFLGFLFLVVGSCASCASRALCDVTRFWEYCPTLLSRPFVAKGLVQLPLTTARSASGFLGSTSRASTRSRPTARATVVAIQGLSPALSQRVPSGLFILMLRGIAKRVLYRLLLLLDKQSLLWVRRSCCLGLAVAADVEV